MYVYTNYFIGQSSNPIKFPIHLQQIIKNRSAKPPVQFSAQNIVKSLMFP